ncbi:MAG: response regulator [Deltaproteobacteria bacterium]|nr:response regulator [Deltaproteobacteria bacterium]
MTWEVEYEKLPPKVKESGAICIEAQEAQEALRENEKWFRDYPDDLANVACKPDSFDNASYAGKMSEIITGLPLKGIIEHSLPILFAMGSQEIAPDVYEKGFKEGSRETPRAGTILVIEDEEVMADVLCVMLEEEGYRTLLARTGKEAAHIARTYDDDIDFAMLDNALSDMGGEEACSLIMETRPNLKAIVA